MDEYAAIVTVLFFIFPGSQKGCNNLCYRNYRKQSEVRSYEPSGVSTVTRATAEVAFFWLKRFVNDAAS